MKFEISNIGDFSDAELKSTFDAMSQNRKERCLRYKHDGDRRRMLAGELLLKKLVSEQCEEKIENIIVENLPSGKPVAFVGGREYNVSISHSEAFAAAAVSQKSVGIDIEASRCISPLLLKKALNEGELSFVGQSENEEPDKDETTRFLQVWTAKEAYLKLTGEGLSGLKKADVLPLILKKEAEKMRLTSVIKNEYVCTVIEAL